MRIVLSSLNAASFLLQVLNNWKAQNERQAYSADPELIFAEIAW
jgi:hypothetical protein